MQYEKAGSIADAVGLLSAAAGTSRVLAGGTDVLVQMRLGLVEPDLVVDIKAIPGFGDILREADGWRIGAAVSGAELSECAELCRDWPGVIEAANLIGSTQVQGRATMAGNLCNASPAADSVPAMIAAGARVQIEGPGGSRTVAVEDIPAGPGKTTLAKGELISAVLLPARGARGGDAYLRFIPRTEMDIAVASAGVSLSLDESGTIAAARVALGAVAPTAVLVPEAGRALVGTKLDGAALAALDAACQAACNPIDDKRGTVEFRRSVAGTLACRAAKIAYARAGGK